MSSSAQNVTRQSQLFRPEAVGAQQSQLHGDIRLVQPVAHRTWAVGAIAMLACIAALMLWGEVTKRATVSGVLQPEAGVARLTSVAGGIVIAVNVRDAEPVEAGVPLFVISSERHTESGGAQTMVGQQLGERQLIAQQDRHRADERYDARKRSLQERLSALSREVAQLEREDELAASRVILARKQLERTEALARGGFVSESQHQAKQDDLLIARQQQQALQRNRASLLKERLALQTQLRDAVQQRDLDHAEASKVLAQIAQEKAENEARRTLVVHAPTSGMVTGLTVTAGQSVQAGAPLAQIVPTASALQAHFYVPTRAAGFVEPGQLVRLRYAAFPYQKFGQQQGTVLAVDRTPYAPRELPELALAALQSSPSATAEAVYRVTVRMEQQHIMAYGKPQALKPGMAVEADVIQRSNKLWEWVMEPLRGFAQRGM